MISLYQKVTDQILIQLQNGTVPWVKPWSATAGRNVPCNAVTNRPYSGVNTLLLWSSMAHAFTTPRFVTFKQANACGGRIRRGQNGFKVYFVKRVQSKTEDQDADDTRKDYTVLREYTVFNIDQCEGLPNGIVHPEPPKVYNHDTRCELADEFVRQSGVHLREGAGEAYYSPGHDCVVIPSWESFSSKDTYYNTLFHELTHWTGHKKRCDRDFKNRFGSRAYAAEELVAELGSSYLCAEFGFDTTTRSASYIQSWIDLLKNDNRAIFTAASRASKAAEWLRQKVLECDVSISTTSTPANSVNDLPDAPSIVPAITSVPVGHVNAISKRTPSFVNDQKTNAANTSVVQAAHAPAVNGQKREHDDAICNSPTVYPPYPEASSEEVKCRYPTIRLAQS